MDNDAGAKLGLVSDAVGDIRGYRAQCAYGDSVHCEKVGPFSSNPEVAAETAVQKRWKRIGIQWFCGSCWGRSAVDLTKGKLRNG